MIELINATKEFYINGKTKEIFKDVSLVIPPKKNIGILGANGVGKSTLLKILGGLELLNEGEIKTDSTFSWTLGLAGGFQGSMTGRENVKFVCRIYIDDEDGIERAINYVKKFSELGPYFDVPMKTYSNGMKSRLSFGLSLFFDFDYLLIDEILSVGDINFRNKSQKALNQKLEVSNAIIVSHSMSTIKEMCDIALLLEDGKIKYYEDVQEGINCYLK